MAILSSNRRYATGAIWLHWLIALALAFQLALGFAMPKGAGGFAYYQFHKSVGIAILLLTLLRIGWRLTHRPPPAVEGGWRGALAKTVHVLLYVFMLGAPLTGWALVSTSPIKVPTMLFGTVPWPHLPLPAALNDGLVEAHELLAWLGIALVVLHVAGALRHQFAKRDGLLGRMGPGGSSLAAGLLGLAVFAAYFATGATIASRVVADGGYPGAQPSQPTEAPAAEVTPAPSPSLAMPVEPTPEPSEAAEEAGAEDAAPSPPPAWTVQPGGRFGFTADYDGQALSGSFTDWTADIVLDPDRPETGRIAVTVRLAGATLGDETQDASLHGDQGLGMGTATWRSSSVRQVGPGRYAAQGTLSLKGVSKSQPLTFTLSGDGMRRKVQGSATIDRTGFGIDSGASAGGRVALTFAFDAVGRPR